MITNLPPPDEVQKLSGRSRGFCAGLLPCCQGGVSLLARGRAAPRVWLRVSRWEQRGFDFQLWRNPERREAAFLLPLEILYQVERFLALTVLLSGNFHHKELPSPCVCLQPHTSSPPRVSSRGEQPQVFLTLCDFRSWQISRGSWRLTVCVPMSLSLRERSLVLRWAFAASTRRVRFAPEISGGFGCVSAARLGLVKLRDAVPDIALTGHPGTLAGRTERAVSARYQSRGRDGLSRLQHRAAALAQRLTGPDNSLSSTLPSWDGAAHWIQYIKLCWRQPPAVPAPVASQLLHVDKKGWKLVSCAVELQSAALRDGDGDRAGQREAFPGTLCPQAFLKNPALCQQQGACFWAL